MVRLLLLLLFYCFTSVWGGTILEDSPSRFSVEENLGNPAIKTCGSLLRISAPGMELLGGRNEEAVPYLVYNIALPEGMGQPTVDIHDISDTLILGKLASALVCDDSTLAKVSPSKGRMDIFMGPSVVRDGIRRMRIGIPLLRQQGSGYLFRKHFQLDVTWPSSGVRNAGGTPGLRALNQVANPRGATSFFRSPPRKSLRRSVSDLSPGIEWILRIPIGDRDLATFNEDGVYALSYAQMQTKLRGTALFDRINGIRVGSLTIAAGIPGPLSDVPETVLPQLGPLREQPIIVLDHGGASGTAGNGIWDDGDTLLFYATGTSAWKASGIDSLAYYFTSNVYSFTRNFYLGVRTDNNAPRLGSAKTGSGGDPVQQLTRYVRAEKDLLIRDTYFGLLQGGFDENSGREWFWIWGDTYKDSLVVASNDLELPQVKNLPGLVPNSKATLTVGFFPYRSLHAGLIDQQDGSYSLSRESEDVRFANLKFRFFVNGEEGQRTGGRLPGGQFVLTSLNLKASNNSFGLHILPNRKQFDRFDGYSISYEAQFSWNGSQETWLLGPRGGKKRFSVSSAPSSLRVLRVLNGLPDYLVTPESGAFSDSLSYDNDIRYHLFQWGNWLSLPDSTLQVVDKTIAGAVEDVSQLSGDFDYLIICPKEWVPNALKIKALREGPNVSHVLKTAVADLDQIWMQYGSGFASPQGIRDFIRMARYQWPSLRYVTLVGDGHPDYRRIRQTSGGYPVIPPFEKEDLGSDDFFAVLDSGESFPHGSFDIDLAVGRLPFNSKADFDVYLRKMEEYENLKKQDMGPWRNTLLMAADDAMQKGEVDIIPGHTEQTERILAGITQGADTSNYHIDIKRLYLLNYDADMANEKPNAAQDLIARINQGALFTAYFGHGSATDWADEGLFRPYMIRDIENQGKYTIIGSFACTVGRFDMATMSSLSEDLILADRKGAIASVGAMRESFPTANEVFATKFLKSAFLDMPQTLGDSYWEGKGKGFGAYTEERYNHSRYVLLGEPAILLPNEKGSVSFNQNIDTVQALEFLTLSGNISGMPPSGKLIVEVREGAFTKTLSQDRPGKDPFLANVEYQGRLIHSEILDYQDGKFSTEFLTPRKLNFGDTSAQIRVWAWSPGNNGVARGLMKNIVLYGTSKDAASILDTVPPEIHFRPCGYPDSLARDYKAGTVVRMEIPACMEVMIRDSLGLDLQEQADEGITFEIKGVKDPWHPTNFLEQSGKRVMTRLRFNSTYSPGVYKLRVNSQDLMGNRQEKDIDIELQGTLKQAITGVFNAPNPFGKSGTTFYFRNLAENHTSAISIEIFGVDGRLVKVIQNAKSGVTRWDGRDQWGRKLANGLYHYVVTCTVYSDGKARRFKAKQKLVISR